MAKLYFRYGVMGSSKSANALMVRYNYEERGQSALMVKPAIDQREGTQVVNSRIGLSFPCVWFEELEQMTLGALRKAVVEGDTVNGTLMAGQIAGLVKKEESCSEIIRDVTEGCRSVLGELQTALF